MTRSRPTVGIGRSLQDLAAIRAGLILVDTAPLADLNARLEPLTAPDRPFRHTARELLALGAWRTGDSAAAKRWFDLIATDTETPAGTRQRIEVLMTLSGEGEDVEGGRDAHPHHSRRCSAPSRSAGCSIVRSARQVPGLGPARLVEEAAAAANAARCFPKACPACRRACRARWRRAISRRRKRRRR